MLYPVGPLPASTYWARRAGVLGGIIVVLILLGILLGSGGSGGGAKKKTAASPTGTAVVIPTQGLASNSPAATASPSASVICADADLAVTITTGAEAYPSGSLPQFVVSVTNTGAAPCKRDVSAKTAVITVVSGSDRIWSSGDCPSVKADVRTLTPGTAVKLTSSWNRERSVPGCTTTGAAGQPAKTGVYVASVKLGTLAAPGTASFHLS